MRFFLRNVIRDRKFDAVRRQNPRKVQRRPVIGGKPLPPGGTKILRRHDFTPELLDEIEQHQEWGNVELLQAGRAGTPVNFEALRALLGFKKAAPPPKPKPLPPPPMQLKADMREFEMEEELAAEEVDAPVGKTDEDDIGARSEEPEEGATAEPMDLEEVLDPPAALSEEPTPYTESELKSLKNDDLRSILAKMGGKGAGLKKSDLVAEILLLQDAE